MFPPLCSPLVLGLMGPLALVAIYKGAAVMGFTNDEYVRELDGVLFAKVSASRGSLPDRFSGPLSPTGLRFPHRPLGPPRAYFEQQVCLGKNRARERYQEALGGVLREPDQDPQQMLDSLADILPYGCSAPSFCPWVARLDAEYGPKTAPLRGGGKPSIFQDTLARCSPQPTQSKTRSTDELRSCLTQDPLDLECLEELASADWKLAREVASGLPASARPELREAAQALAQFEGREPLRRWLIERRFLLEDPLESDQKRRALGVPAVLIESGQAAGHGDSIEALWSVLWPGQDLTVEAEAPPDSPFCTDDTSSLLFAHRGGKNFTLLLVDESNSVPCSHVPGAMLIPSQIGFLNSVALETGDPRRLLPLRETKSPVRGLSSLVIAAPPESLREARSRKLIDSSVALQPVAEDKAPKGSP